MSIDRARHWLKQRLYAHGLRAGVPYGALRRLAETADALCHPIDTLRRRRAARRLLAGSPWADFVPRQTGFRSFAAGELPGLEPLIEAGRAIYRRHAEAGLPPRGGNPFHTLCDADDFARHPEMLDVALSAPLVEAATGYFGTVPKLAYMDVWVTRPNAEGDPFHSQRFHLDKMDSGILTLFVALNDIAEDDGPFVLLPADVSRRVRRGAGYEAISILGDGRLDDAAISAHSRPEDRRSLTGGAGAGALVDTSVCLHHGSRCRSGERLVVVIRYMPAHRSRLAMAGHIDARRFAGQPLARMLLPGAR